ncbi:uncharacterized protein ARMOST_15028 [Armillaria ostoyae]|uniref:Uncharacterized protein n=1 Tax=Armillaria ostoyae TaxID=47428 RepID=A0A284RS77_ARMOS|nr:uncharacterized protein ARMOST_15028 [Armillaria ostoyae]
MRAGMTHIILLGDGAVLSLSQQMTVFGSIVAALVCIWSSRNMYQGDCVFVLLGKSLPIRQDREENGLNCDV